MPELDAIIVGSGAGGMTAGLKLAREDCRVLVLEAMPSFGGYLNPFQRNGFHYDTGLHYVGDLADGAAFRLLLDELGLGQRLSFVELDPDDVGLACLQEVPAARLPGGFQQKG